LHQEAKGAIAMNGDRQRLRGHFDLVLPALLDRSYRTWDQDLSKRTYFGHPPAEASLESRV